MNPAATAWVAALRGTHERLRTLVGRLTRFQLTGRAYPEDWTIAQVMAHLGAGAEAFIGRIDAVRAGAPDPGRDAYDAIRQAWSERSPQDQATEAIAVNQRLVELFEELVGGAGAHLRFNVVGRELDL